MMMNEEAQQLPEDQAGAASNEATPKAPTETTETAKPAEEASAAEVEAPTKAAAAEQDDDEQDEQGGTISKVEAEDDHDAPKERKLPIPEYDDMTIDEALAVIKEHVAQYSPERIKGIVESGRSRILSELNHEKELARRAHLEEHGNDLDFRFDQPQRKVLAAMYNTYRDGLRAYYNTLEKQLNHNLQVKTEIVEQIKALPMKEGSAKSKYEHFKTLRDQWNATGPVPKESSRDLWYNYNHHVDNFFDFLRMAYELIDKDYENNMAEKVKMIEHLESLLADNGTADMFRILQQYHSKWKRIGPVPREHRDELWDRFKAVTATIHEKRDQYQQLVQEANDEKLRLKKAVVESIVQLTQPLPEKHSQWQKASKRLNELRATFKAIGFVKSDENDQIWEEYRAAQREFNQLKNKFYKEEKKRQQDNFDAKKALVDLANSVKDSEDFAETANVLKKAQADWKKTGYVNKKDGDQLWEAFRAACNHFFDRMNGQRKAAQNKVNSSIDAKKKVLSELKSATLSSLEDALAWSERWSALGAVPRKFQQLDADFDEALSKGVAHLGLSVFDVENALWESKIAGLVQADDQDGLMSQRNALRERLDAAKKELHQLENNIAFFGNSKGNPLLAMAQQKIEEQKALVDHLVAMRKQFNRLLK